MLSSEIVKKIEDFVSQKPRSIQEIATHIKKNWRTVDRYINEIKENYGTIDTRTFREGTRGALKLVYWASIENVSSSSIQKALEEEIYELKLYRASLNEETFLGKKGGSSLDIFSKSY